MGCLAGDSEKERTCSIVRAPADGAAEIRGMDWDDLGICAVLASGRVRCWSGQRSWVVRGVRDAVQVVKESERGCARLRDGTVRCWASRGARGQRLDVVNAIALAMTSKTTCAALRTGHVACWGRDDKPRSVANIHDAVDVALGEAVYEGDTALGCARLTDGGVACWDPRTGSAARRLGGAANIVELKINYGSACARDREDGVWCWGNNLHFTFGDADSSPTVVRPLLIPGIPPAVQVVLGSTAACARTGDGELWCWGWPFATEAQQQAAAVRVAEGARIVAMGGERLYAELDPGVLSSRFLYGMHEFQEEFTLDIDALALGDRWGCGIQAGQLTCFSRDHRDEPRWRKRLDLGRRAMVLSSAVVSLGIEGLHGCVALADGRALCWGENNELGNLGPEAPVATGAAIDKPVVVTGLPPVDAIAVGNQHACARTRTGEVWCWGDASGGQLGGETQGLRGQPQRVMGIPPVAQVAAGSGHTCARSVAGELWCWGVNGSGQLGRGDTSLPSAVPAPVRGLAGVSAVVLAGSTSCVVVADGAVACWGDNDARQASPRGLLRADHAVPVDRSKISWVDRK